MIGRPATDSIGLGRSSVSGRSRTPWPPAMITAQFVRVTGSRNCWSRCSPTGRPSASTTGTASMRRARMSSRAAARPSSGVTARYVRVRTGATGSVRAVPREQRAPEVAVGHDAGQAALVVHGQRDAGGASVHGGHGVADRRRLGDEVRVQGVAHEPGS